MCTLRAAFGLLCCDDKHNRRRPQFSGKQKRPPKFNGDGSFFFRHYTLFGIPPRPFFSPQAIFLPQTPQHAPKSRFNLQGIVAGACRVLIFSAMANSSSGESLQTRMEEREKLAVENASKFRALAEQARKDS